jgi:hypothetical protein
VIIGDPIIFALEWGITQAYECLSFRALGFFVIHVNGHRYGVHAPDATMLACSFNEVERRIAHRGTHTAPFAIEPDAGKIADAYRNAFFADEPKPSFFGIPLTEFSGLFHSDLNDLVWAPDGDEAFDDGSYVLQFDVQDRVRIIAFRSRQEDYPHDPTTLSDVWLMAENFYGILQQWHHAFESAWASMPKVMSQKKG